jgi:hypothetical protein
MQACTQTLPALLKHLSLLLIFSDNITIRPLGAIAADHRSIEDLVRSEKDRQAPSFTYVVIEVSSLFIVACNTVIVRLGWWATA